MGGDILSRVINDGPNGWLNLRAARLFWREEEGQRDPEAGNAERNATQLRWMTNPCQGLDRQVFTVWRAPQPEPTMTKVDAANDLDWEPIEFVGLPVDDRWANTRYPLDLQGPVNAPVSPWDAALMRLSANAPPSGWMADAELPAWEEPRPDAYLKSLVEGRILNGIRSMLEADPPPKHFNYSETYEDNLQSQLMPKLLLNGVVAELEGDRPASGTWHPYRVMCMSASADPLAALAFGFGTGFNDDNECIYMVTVLRRDEQTGAEMELADVVRPTRLSTHLPPPAGLSVTRSGFTRPQVTDGPSMDSVRIAWDRAISPETIPWFNEEAPQPVAYAIGRVGPTIGWRKLMLTRREADVRGWLSYVPSAASGDIKSAFQDHILRESFIVPEEPFADPVGAAFTYYVAAQDLYGRWSLWNQVDYTTDTETARAPELVSFTQSEDGAIQVVFSWDWSDRSPAFMQVNVSWADDPDTILASRRLDFNGASTPEPAGDDIAALSHALKPVSWGDGQDKRPGDPGTRFYSWTVPVVETFGPGQSKRVLQAWAFGQKQIHHMRFADWMISPPGPPRQLELYNSRTPGTPAIDPVEAPLWASLPDSMGISHFDLNWHAVEDVAGYHVYEATETALLSALNLSGPDIAQPLTERLRLLRGREIQNHRTSFRRITTTPLAEPRMTVHLPRGSRVMHFFAITAETENHMASHWPAQSDQFAAVAVPRLDIPEPPSLSVSLMEGAVQQARIRVELATGGAGRVELFRVRSVSAAADIDSMGPVLQATNAVDGIAEFVDGAIAPDWSPYYYRAQVWSQRDDQRGIVEARSSSSPMVSVLVPPPPLAAPSDLVGNQAFSVATASLVSWRTEAPRRNTPLGPFKTVLEIRDSDATVRRLRLVQGLPDIPVLDTAALPEPGLAGAPTIFQLSWGGSNQYFAWVERDAGASFHMTARTIDPRGMIASATLEVPPLAPDAEFVTVPAWSTKEEVEQGDDMGAVIFSAESLGLRVTMIFDQERPGFFNEQVISISPPPGSVVTAGSQVTVVINLSQR
jgi:hypothetical protein